MSPTKGGKAAPETATDRLSRLLTMVPWLVNRQGIDLQQAADELGITPQQLETDLRLLYLCGYGQMTDELIDASGRAGGCSSPTPTPLPARSDSGETRR